MGKDISRSSGCGRAELGEPILALRATCLAQPCPGGDELQEPETALHGISEHPALGLSRCSTGVPGSARGHPSGKGQSHPHPPPRAPRAPQVLRGQDGAGRPLLTLHHGTLLNTVSEQRLVI